MGQSQGADGEDRQQPAPVLPPAPQPLPEGPATRPTVRVTRRIRWARTARRIGRRADLLSLAVLAGIVGSGFLVEQTTNAAFSATTTNGTNSWASGTVSLTDDDSAVAMFSASPLAPGASASHCIQVTYGGSLPSAIRLYASGLTGTLGPDLTLLVQQSTGGSFADCTGFNTGAATTLYSGTVSALAAASSSYATGVTCWSASGAGQSRVLKFTWTLNPAVANSQQGASASVGFVWEAQS